MLDGQIAIIQKLMDMHYLQTNNPPHLAANVILHILTSQNTSAPNIATE